MNKISPEYLRITFPKYVWKSTSLPVNCYWDFFIFKGTEEEQVISDISYYGKRALDRTPLSRKQVKGKSQQGLFSFCLLQPEHSEGHQTWLTCLLCALLFCKCAKSQKVSPFFFSFFLDSEPWGEPVGSKTEDVGFVFHTHFPRIKRIKCAWGNQAQGGLQKSSKVLRL